VNNADLVNNLNKAFPKYPKTIYDKGWIYGVWYCGKKFKKAQLYGEYPATFFRRIKAMFSEIEESKFLHLFSGTMGQDYGVTLDGSNEFKPDITHILTKEAPLPFKDNSFEVVLADPPYSKEHALNYGLPYPPPELILKEAMRVLRPDGYFLFLHTMYPSYNRKEIKLIGLIAIITGFKSVTRLLSIFKKDSQFRIKDEGEI